MSQYYHTKESMEEYIRLAKDVNGGALIEKLRKYLPVDSQVLEIGSGPGTDWNLLNKDYHVIGSDNSVEFLRHLHTTYPSGNFVELDAVTLETPEKFDGIYSNKVLHHLKDQQLVDSIKRQHGILNDNGIVCHSFWRGEGSEIFKGLFVNYHLEPALKKFFEGLFEILLLEPYAEFDEGDSLLLIAKKDHKFHHF